MKFKCACVLTYIESKSIEIYIASSSVAGLALLAIRKGVGRWGEQMETRIERRKDERVGGERGKEEEDEEK